MRAVAGSSRAEDIVMYTGNDDNIVADLMTSYAFKVDGKDVQVDFKGGLLGHWAVWTHKAVALLAEIKTYKANPTAKAAADLLKKGVWVTDVNAALFDPAHEFEGCIPGIHEVLKRQGLMEGIWCLNPEEVLSAGQKEEIDRVYRDYPTLNDDEFVKYFLENEQTEPGKS